MQFMVTLRHFLSVLPKLLLCAACPALLADPSHPFLFFKETDLPQFRENVRTVPESKDSLARMVRWLDARPPIHLPPENPTIREEWWPAVRENGRTALYSAFLYLLEGDRQRLETAREYLMLYAEHFEDRVNFHNIEDKDGIVIYLTGDLGIRSAWTYDMIYDELSPAERTFIEDNLLRATVQMVRDTIGKTSLQELWAGDMAGETSRAPDYDWGPGQWNGNMYCNSGLAAIGFVLQDKDLIEHTIGNWKVYLERDMLSDGMWQEEDYAYSRFCYTAMQLIAEMAHQYGWHEDLYTWEVMARPLDEWDPGYIDSPIVRHEGEWNPRRSMRRFLDAQIDYQYPDLGPGNWGWQTNKADFTRHGSNTTFFELAYRRYNDPVYGWVLQQMDRSRGNGYAQSFIGPILYAGLEVEEARKPDTRSRWYNHAKWLVLKSVEGEDYWESDSLYAFMPYSGQRTKYLRPLSLDLFAYGKVVAPRVAKNSRLQAHDKDYYLTDDSWNAYLVDGENVTPLKHHFAESWTRFHAFSPELKIAQACLRLERKVRPSIWFDEVAERRPGDDRVDSRLLAMTGEYLLDVLAFRYEQEQAFKRHYEWVWHAFGELELDGVVRGELTHEAWSATWLDPADHIGLRTHMLGSAPRGGTKVSVRDNAYGPYLRVLRGNFAEHFVALHEPFRGEPSIDAVAALADADGVAAVMVEDSGQFTDYLSVAFEAAEASVEAGPVRMLLEGKFGYIRVAGGTVTARGDFRGFRIPAEGVDRVILNGRPVTFEAGAGTVAWGAAAR